MSRGCVRRENPGFIVCNFPSPSALRLAPSGYPPCSRCLVAGRASYNFFEAERLAFRSSPAAKVSRESFDARPLLLSKASPRPCSASCGSGLIRNKGRIVLQSGFTIDREYASKLLIYIRCGGRGEIRTHEGLAPLPVFKTGALNHSATLPY